MPRFPRTVPPRASTAPRVPAPFRSRSVNSRGYARDLLAASRTWTEGWPPIRADDAGRAFIATVDEFAREGTLVELTPHTHRKTAARVIEGSPGAVDGAGQLGNQLATKGWPAGGTFAKGDYLIVAGVDYPLVIGAPATASAAGLVTFDLSTRSGPDSRPRTTP